MALGTNRATDPMRSFLFSVDTSKPCIFLSHRSLDKEHVRSIANYIAKVGIDYYLDENDQTLQEADAAGDDNETVNCIKQGIRSSTHVLCILSENTVSSWWVPYEIGFGDNANKGIASLKLRELPQESIPSYLRIHQCVIGLADFNDYLQQIAEPYGGLISKKIVKTVTEINDYTEMENVVLANYNIDHPLFNIIDQ